MELIGKVEVIQEVEEKGTFKKQSLILQTELSGQYPQFVNIEFQQNNCDLLNAVVVGDDVKVSINISGRKWTNPEGRDIYFNTIKGWKIEKTSTF